VPHDYPSRLVREHKYPPPIRGDPGDDSMTGWTPDSLTVTVVGSIGTFELPNPYEKMEDSMIPCVISHAFSHSFLPFLQTSSRRCQGLRDILSRFQ
jgi:hypothetical protein